MSSITAGTPGFMPPEEERRLYSSVPADTSSSLYLFRSASLSTPHGPTILYGKSAE